MERQASAYLHIALSLSLYRVHDEELQVNIQNLGYYQVMGLHQPIFYENLYLKKKKGNSWQQKLHQRDRYNEDG